MGTERLQRGTHGPEGASPKFCFFLEFRLIVFRRCFANSRDFNAMPVFHELNERGHYALKQRDLPSECEFYAVKEVARILGVCPAWVYNRIGTDELPPYVRIGRLVKFSKTVFNRWKQQKGASPNV